MVETCHLVWPCVENIILFKSMRFECKNGLRNVFDRPPLQGREGVGQYRSGSLLNLDKS